MPEFSGQVPTSGATWIESVGKIIVAYIRGTPTIELLREVQLRLDALIRETGSSDKRRPTKRKSILAATGG